MPRSLRECKNQRKITVITAYDYPTAQVLSKAGVDVLLVGDSLGMVVYGDTTTHFVTLEEMIRHTMAVMRGHTSGLVVADLPKSSYDTVEMAMESARKLTAETGVKVLKIEGCPEICEALVEAGFEVMGHTGLKPQETSKMKVKGRSQSEAEEVLKEAQALEAAGCLAVVLECIPSELAQKVTEKLKVPTIGIGAGPHCDGQVLVVSDLMGLYSDFQPKFVKRYAEMG
ncbi:3-methyl-2-oxobutanoate hydroxymethyltransferase, partial [Candidatus Peregrinibacteria bacterium]|nr:3-methyl-2-oxobutanoate hydroxymethyltransferase [Candidatus Peregrinibacteria bacterium]